MKRLILIAFALTATGCVSTEPVKLAPFDYNLNATKDDIYLAAVDCTLEKISIPTGKGQFFDYQDRESGRLSVAFESSYILGLSQVPLKVTMSIKTKDNNLNIKFNSLRQYLSSTGWIDVYQNSNATVTDAEKKIDGIANEIYSCISKSIN